MNISTFLKENKKEKKINLTQQKNLQRYKSFSERKNKINIFNQNEKMKENNLNKFFRPIDFNKTLLKKKLNLWPKIKNNHHKEFVNNILIDSSVILNYYNISSDNSFKNDNKYYFPRIKYENDQLTQKDRLRRNNSFLYFKNGNIFQPGSKLLNYFKMIKDLSKQVDHVQINKINPNEYIKIIKGVPNIVKRHYGII